MSKNIKLTDENNDYKFFCILQNVLSRIGLTAFERSLYWAIKECCGEDRSCTKSIANLALMSGMGERSVQRTLKSLATENKILKKPLIRIVSRPSSHGDNDTNQIFINDIWTDNINICQYGGGATQSPPPVIKSPPGATQSPGGVPHSHPGGATQSPKQQPINNNPYINTTTPTSSKPKSTVVVVVSNEMKKEAKKLKDWMDKESEIPKKVKIAPGSYETKTWGKSWIIPLNSYESLISEYGVKYVADQANYMGMQQQSFDEGKSKKPIDKPETYLKLACKKNYADSINHKEKTNEL